MPSPSDGTQEPVLALLADPATYGASQPVRRIDTHAAIVFLAGSDVYKVKRAVRFPFMDQSTLELRRRACEAEVRVNRAFTPQLYRGTTAITRDKDALRLGGKGEPIEWAVHMKRFDESQTLDLIAERGELNPLLIAKVASLILASHALAKVDTHAALALEAVIEETLQELVEARDVFPGPAAASLAKAMRASFANVRSLLVQRATKGGVRRCHGDLHLRNVAMLDGEPILFDAIEFDEAIATIDVLYDLAFVLMDLCERGLVGAANLLLNRYLWGCGDIDFEIAGLAALPLFLSLRAAVRAKVEALRFRDVDSSPTTRDQARRYFDIAREVLQPTPAVLIAIGGLSGTGKTSLAAQIAPRVGRLPGAVHLRSDIERKRLYGVAEREHLPEKAYRADVTDRVFAALRRQADTALRAGQGVIVDAVHGRQSEREAISAVAADAGARFAGLWLEAPVGTLIGRVDRRDGDASDASGEVVVRQAKLEVGPISWARLDASVSPAELKAAAAGQIGRLMRPEAADGG